MNPLKEAIETLYPMNRCLLGEGYDSALTYLNHLFPLDIIEVKSGTKLSTWTVPEEWIVKDAWVKFNGEKIIDYAKEPLSLVVGSLPFAGTITHEELAKHISHGDTDATPYIFRYYDQDWGFAVPKDFPLVEGEYEVFIETGYKPGVMNLGVHTIPGKSEREILLFAHLDHPFQANDNLSGVACLLDVAAKIKCDHTIKIVFCPETIGSQAYALTQDTSNVDFVIAVDICGNDAPLLFQLAHDVNARINHVAHVAIQGLGQQFSKGKFRVSIGSDEYAFNDPLIGIPGIMLSRHPYPQYHTAADTPERIDYDAIVRTADVVRKIIEVYEKDFIPVRKFIGPVMRSRFDIQTPSPQLNLSYDYLFYAMDGEKPLSTLCHDYGTNFDYTLLALQKMEDEGFIEREAVGGAHPREGEQHTTSKQEHARLPRGTDVRGKRKKVPKGIR